jgi:ubiquinone/menaquinone biosynthesis C-methylase UbiE
VVHGISNHLIWKCPTKIITENYKVNMTNNHLEIGVGTGYFLRKCKKINHDTTVTLMDLNKDTLIYCFKKLYKLTDKIIMHQGDIFTNQYMENQYDSIAINYVLHCLPGNGTQKMKIFSYLEKYLKPGGVLFGSTIICDGLQNPSAKALMKFYNDQGIFSNIEDTISVMKTILFMFFDKFQYQIVNNVFIFSAWKK